MKTTKTKNLLLGIAIGIGTSFATVAQNVPNYVPTNGLVGWWPFNGNANDESGNNNNGTVNGATLTSDRFGLQNSSYNFNGTSDYITIPAAANNVITGSYSISFWLKINPWLNELDGHEVISDRDASSYNYRFRMNFGATQLPDTTAIQTVVANQVYTIFSSIPTVNSWEHYVICYSSTNQVLSAYKNGSLINSINNVPFEPNAREINLGRTLSPIFPNGLAYYSGIIDDIGYWNRVLTQQEITDLYNANICYQTVTVTDTLIINTNLVGFNPITYQNTIKIFPNPTSDHITINYGNFATLNGYQLKIINSLGQQMFQTAINQQSSYINLSNWTGNGIYFVQIIDPQGNIIDIRKIVLQ